MVSPAKGSVVLVAFPFSDLSASKLRPAIVPAPSAFAAFKQWALGVRCWMLDVCFSTPVISSSSRSGIALIMTLGVLSVMVIMAVAFAVSMRTERLAAGNYADGVRARQLVQTGLARALDDLAGKLGTNGLMSVVGGTNYPPWIVINSYTNPAVFSFGGTVITNQATNFVPRALWSAATNADQSGAANHWLPIDSLVYTNYLGTSYLVASNRMGAVKYLILNCSGLLDANFVGGHPQGRGTGTNPTEIAITNLPEFDAPSDAQNFLDNRAAYYRYETLEELTALNQDAFDPYPTNFTVYSHAPAGCWSNNAVSNQVNLAGTYGQIEQRTLAISNGFVYAGFTINQAEILFNNLYNYMLGGAIPVTPGAMTANFTNIVTAVPMINEILLESSVDGLGARNVITFELWFPFVTPAPAGYQLRIKVDLSAGADIPETTDVIPIAGTNLALLSFTSLDGALNSPYTFTIQKAEVLNAVGVPVDMLLEPSISTPSAPVTTGGDKVSYQCIDPRFNWNLFNVNQWKVYTGPNPGKLGETNTSTLNHMAANPDCDQDGAMYTGTAAQQLQSVGELGFLVYDTWRTVKLYGPKLHPVLDVFAIGTNAIYTYVTNTVYRGRVNPNTRQAEVLSAVFSNMPINEYPGQAGAAKLETPAEIQAIVNDIQTEFYTNVSQVGRYFADSSFPAAADNELKREAIFRNTAGLLSVRQNLFTIIIEAIVASGGNIPINPIRQRAVALVWRDPYTGEMFVRSIKWLRD